MQVQAQIIEVGLQPRNSGILWARAYPSEIRARFGLNQ